MIRLHFTQNRNQINCPVPTVSKIFKVPCERGVQGRDFLLAAPEFLERT